MKRWPLLLLVAPGLLFAAEKSVLQESYASLSDLRSIQRGARTFVNYCIGCHSAEYMRYERLHFDLSIPEDVLRENFMFGTDKTGATMTSAMSREDATLWLGAPPPDLSVIARARGADWLYTFLLSFYEDATRPHGVNNLLQQGTSMPHVLWELQGTQKAVYELQKTEQTDHKQKIVVGLELNRPGLLSEKEYRSVVRDLVNFLTYMGEPIKLKRVKIGVWVIVYLLILMVLLWMLKHEYWKDVR